MGWGQRKGLKKRICDSSDGRDSDETGLAGPYGTNYGTVRIPLLMSLPLIIKTHLSLNTSMYKVMGCVL